MEENTAAEKNGAERIWEMRLDEVAKNLKANMFGVKIFPDLAAAVAYFRDTMLRKLAPQSAAVCGSETVRTSGVWEILDQADLKFMNPYAAGVTDEESDEIRRQSLLADLFVTSTNALTRDGKLLNLDRYSNRVAAMAFGPKKVVLFVGRNKICEDLQAGIARIRSLAAPANNLRIGTENPCTQTGYCVDCQSPGRICCTWTYMVRSHEPRRVHVLLINEDLGF